jgi:hypothetical protein
MRYVVDEFRNKHARKNSEIIQIRVSLSVEVMEWIWRFGDGSYKPEEKGYVNIWVKSDSSSLYVFRSGDSVRLDALA